LGTHAASSAAVIRSAALVLCVAMRMVLISMAKGASPASRRLGGATLFLNSTFHPRAMPITSLPDDWAYAPALDAELKRYQLLAYVQRVQAGFAALKLYPLLHELDHQVSGLLRLREGLSRAQREIGGELAGFDAATGMPVHAPLPADPWIALVEDVIGEAVPTLKEALTEGRAIRDEIGRGIRARAHSCGTWSPVRPSARMRAICCCGTVTRRAFTRTAFGLPMVAGAFELPERALAHTLSVTTYTLGLGLAVSSACQGRTPRAATARTAEPGGVRLLRRTCPCRRIETYVPVAKQHCAPTSIG
jgi:hypothetical protein